MGTVDQFERQAKYLADRGMLGRPRPLPANGRQDEWTTAEADQFLVGLGWVEKKEQSDAGRTSLECPPRA